MPIKLSAGNARRSAAAARTASALASLLLMASALIAEPATVSVSSASLTINRTGLDSYSIGGSFSGISLAGAQAVLFGVGQFGAGVPLSAFAHKAGTSVYEYKDTTGLTPYWISSLTIDIDKEAFSATATGIVLNGLGNPFALRIGTSSALACGIVRVQEATSSTSKTETYELTPGEPPTQSCTISAAVAVPSVVPVKTETKVTVTMQASDLDARSAHLYVANTNAQPSGQALCTFSQNVNGTYSCTATFSETTARVVPLLVEASVKGKSVLAPGLFIQAVAPASDDEKQAQLASVQTLLASGNGAYARYGDSVAARIQLLAALRQQMPAQAGLTGQPVGLSPDGSELSVIVASGVPLNYNISSPQPAPAAAKTTQDPGLPERVASPASDDGSGSVERADAAQPMSQPPQCGDFNRQIIGNNNVLLWDPGETFFPGWHIASEVATALSSSACPKFTITSMPGPKATLASVAEFRNYSTIIIDTHGGFDGTGNFFIVSGQVDPFVNGSVAGVWCSRLPVLPEAQKPTCYFTVYTNNPNLQVSPYTLVYGGFCDGYGITLPNNGVSVFRPTLGKSYFPGPQWDSVFARNPENAFVGYQSVVYSDQDIKDGKAFFDGLVNSYQDVAEAVQAVGDAQLMASPNGPDLAYVGNPQMVLTTKSPAIPGSQVLAATLEGTAICSTSRDMEVEWTNPATAGHLSPRTLMVDGSQDSFRNLADCDNAAGSCDADAIGKTIPPHVNGWALAEYTPDALLPGSNDHIMADFYPHSSGPPAGRACLTVQSNAGLFLQSELATGYNATKNFAPNPTTFKPWEKITGTKTYADLSADPGGTFLQLSKDSEGNYTVVVSAGADYPYDGYVSANLYASNPGPKGKARVKVTSSWSSQTQAEAIACSSQPTCNFPDATAYIGDSEFSLGYSTAVSGQPPFPDQTLDSSSGTVGIYIGMNGNGTVADASVFGITIKIQFEQ